MRAGDLRKRIIIEQPTVAADSVGEMVPTWSTLAVLWASIEALTGSERLQDAQINATADVKISVRYRAGITTAMRIKYGTRQFEIVSVQNVEERNRELAMLCVEHLA